jgi:hypothetical protein
VSKRQPDLFLGHLPVDLINKTIGTEPGEGTAIFTRYAQQHVIRRHPEDYQLCLPHIEKVISNPTYVGDDHKNSGIELISKVFAVSSYVLVAVGIQPDGNGRYQVHSFYRISEGKIQSRRQKGFLWVAKKT